MRSDVIYALVLFFMYSLIPIFMLPIIIFFSAIWIEALDESLNYLFGVLYG